MVVTLDVHAERPDGTALNFSTVTVTQQVNQFLMQRNCGIQRLYPYDLKKHAELLYFIDLQVINKCRISTMICMFNG